MSAAGQAGRLVQHDADLWSAEHEFGWHGGLVRIPVRMTVIRLTNGELVLHSPIPVPPELGAELEALGPVGFLVVPWAHGRFAAEAKERFPKAQLLAAPSPPGRRSSLEYAGSLADEPPGAWRDRVTTRLLKGFRLNEVVLLHQPSRTLVIPDLCFNIQRSSSGLARAFFRANGMWQHFGPSRLIRRLAVSNRVEFQASLEEILGWDFERILPGHGDVMERGGPDALRAAWQV